MHTLLFCRVWYPLTVNCQKMGCAPVERECVKSEVLSLTDFMEYDYGWTSNALCYAWRQCLRWTFSQTVSPKLELSVSALVIRRSLAVLLFSFPWHRWQILLQFEKINSSFLKSEQFSARLAVAAANLSNCFKCPLSGAICGQFGN